MQPQVRARLIPSRAATIASDRSPRAMGASDCTVTAGEARRASCGARGRLTHPFAAPRASSLFTVTNKLRGGACEMTSHGTVEAHQDRQSRTIIDLLGQRSTFGEDGRERFVAAA